MSAGPRVSTQRWRRRRCGYVWRFDQPTRPAGAGEISVSAIARAAGVDRTFLYRYDDLLSQIHAAQTNPTAAQDRGPMVSRASLLADLANAHGQITRLAARVRQLEQKLSELRGERVWRETGLGGPSRYRSSCSAGLPSWSNGQSSCGARPRNAIRNSRLREPRTANSSPT